MYQLNPASSLCEAMSGSKERVTAHSGKGVVGEVGRRYNLSEEMKADNAFCFILFLRISQV